jgi:uncharacterized protein (DUF488 family)
LASLLTIGHSTRPLRELIDVLHAHSIQILVDIRSMPMSRRLPHFNREPLQQSLAGEDIRYAWLQSLGGRRQKIVENSPNIVLRNLSFRNYADYMLTGKFRSGINELLALAGEARTAYMCAERVYFRCHRMLVSDWLVGHGHDVCHIDGTGPCKPHRLTAEARIENGQLLYRGDLLL